MAEMRKEYRFFTITDYEQEEEWLREMHKEGWELVNYTVPISYTFQQCEPSDMIYKLEFEEKSIDREMDYLNLLTDYGWKHLFTKMGWRYFCKPATGEDDPAEIFSDDESKLAQVERIYKRRMLPFLVIFLCCVIPQTMKYGTHTSLSLTMTIFWDVLFVAYLWITLHCTKGIRRLRAKYSQGK